MRASRTALELGIAFARLYLEQAFIDIVFPRMAWVASVDEVINAIRG